MKIILVGSSISGMGKTQLCELLFSNFDDFSALKVTTVREGDSQQCPRDKPCGTCRVLPEGWHIEDNPIVLMENGKDTERYIKAGAVKTLWLVATPNEMREGIKKALSLLASEKVVVIEGNAPLPHLIEEGLSPLVIFLSATDRVMKESAGEVQRCAQIIVPAGEGDYPYQLSDMQHLFRPFSPGGLQDFLNAVGTWCGVSLKTGKSGDMRPQ